MCIAIDILELLTEELKHDYFCSNLFGKFEEGIIYGKKGIRQLIERYSFQEDKKLDS